MKADVTKIRDLITYYKQFLTLNQGTYKWDEKEWEQLWKDLIGLYKSEKPRTHYLGLIITLPIGIPDGIATYLLIDGHQRLTTLIIILTLLRNKSRETGDIIFEKEINYMLLVNPNKKGGDLYKIMPAHPADKEAYINLINNKPQKEVNQIIEAYNFFEKKLMEKALDNKALMNVIMNHLSVVNLVLDPEDNPYLIVESFSKGLPLSHDDSLKWRSTETIE